MNQGVITKESEGMSGKHEKVGSNKSLEDVNNDHDTLNLGFSHSPSHILNLMK